MRHPSIRALFAYWNLLREGRPAPERRELDPRGFARELGDVFLLDGEPADFAFRLAGSRLTATLKRELTGQPFASVFVEARRREAEGYARLTAETLDPVLLGTRLLRADDRAWPESVAGSSALERRRPVARAGEILLLPLRFKGTDGARLLGAFASLDPVPAGGPAELDLTGTRVLNRAPRPTSGIGLLPPALADRVIARRGHLTLVRGSLDETDRG